MTAAGLQPFVSVHRESITFPLAYLYPRDRADLGWAFMAGVRDAKGNVQPPVTVGCGYASADEARTAGQRALERHSGDEGALQMMEQGGTFARCLAAHYRKASPASQRELRDAYADVFGDYDRQARCSCITGGIASTARDPAEVLP